MLLSSFWLPPALPLTIDATKNDDTQSRRINSGLVNKDTTELILSFLIALALTVSAGEIWKLAFWMVFLFPVLNPSTST
jgi:hypothetical protein